MRKVELKFGTWPGFRHALCGMKNSGFEDCLGRMLTLEKSLVIQAIGILGPVLSTVNWLWPYFDSLGGSVAEWISSFFQFL